MSGVETLRVETLRVETLRRKLFALARNLWWTWQPEVRKIYRDLDLEVWNSSNHNPVELLERLPEGRWTALAADPIFLAGVDRAFRLLQSYLSVESTWASIHAGALVARPVAYFCSEFALYECLTMYSGGMGVLAGDHLKSASDLGIPLVGVGLFYREGYFRQTVDAEGRQHAEYCRSDPGRLPMDLVKGPDGAPVLIQVRLPQGAIHAQIWNATVGRCRLLLLDADVEANTQETRALSLRLYAGDQQLRIQQEILLGIGGVRALQALGIRPGVLHMNEGHCAFASLEMARQIRDEAGCPLSEALREARSRTVFTTHTPVPAGHDWFPPDLVEAHLGTFRESLGMTREAFLAMGQLHAGAPGEPFCMSALAIRMARGTNAVSAVHGRVSRQMWQDLWPGRAEDEIPIGHITNGVHAGSWIAHEIQDLCARVVHPNWIVRIRHADLWEGIYRVEESDLWSIHEILKVRLLQYIRGRLATQYRRWGVDPDREPCYRSLDRHILTVGFARRFATYKWSTLLLTDPARLASIVNHPQRPVQFIFAGKAHPNDAEGQEMIRQIVQASRKPEFGGRIVFVEDYDMGVARRLVQGVDIWLNHPRRPLEACGTSGQKAAMNGVLNLSVLDGWWPEGWDGRNGFAVPATAVPTDGPVQARANLDGIFRILEDEVAPLYYDRGEDGIPRGWVARMKRSIRTLLWRFNSDRMVIDYARGAYLPAAGAASRDGRVERP